MKLIDKDRVAAEIEKMVKRLEDAFDNPSFASYEANLIAKGGYCKLKDILSFLDSLEVKEVDNVWHDANETPKGAGDKEILVQFADSHAWKPADGKDLPEIDKEVIVLTQSYPLEGNEYAVSFAHRPNPNGWDGRNILTGEVNHYTPKTYDNGGWNIPDVKWWLDLDLPKHKMEE